MNEISTLGTTEELELGERLRRSRNLPEAEAAFRRVLAVDPGLMRAQHGLSAVLRDLNRPAEALPHARRALELAPDDPWRHVQLGNVLAALGQAEGAANAYDDAFALQHYLSGVPYALALQLALIGRTAAAARAHGLAAAEAPKDGKQLRKTGETWLAAARPEEAVPWLRRARDRGEPVEPQLARALLAQGRREGLDLLAAGPQADITLAEEITLIGMLRGHLSGQTHLTLACLPALAALLDKAMPQIRPVPRPANPALIVAAQLVRLLDNGPAVPQAPLAAAPWLAALNRPRPADGKRRVAVDRRGPVPLPESFWEALEMPPAAVALIDLDGIDEQRPDLLLDALAETDAVISAGGVTAHLAGALGKEGLVVSGPGSSWVWWGRGEAGLLHPGLRLLHPDADGGWIEAAATVRALLEGGPQMPAAPRMPRLPAEALDDAILADTLLRLPLPAASMGEPIACRSIAGGFQNRTWKLEAGASQFALRMPKFPSVRWSFYADELVNATHAAEAGLGPPVLYFDEADGTMLTRFVEGPPMNYSSFLDMEKVTQAGKLYRQLHTLPRFHSTYDIFPMIDTQRDRIADDNPFRPADFARMDARVGELRALLLANQVPPLSCHNDPVPQNFIDTGKGLVLLDWQCAATADPHWELAAFCAQIALTPELEKAMMRAYFGRADHPGAARVQLYKSMCCLYWICSGLARLGDNAEDKLALEDLEKYTPRLRAALADPHLPVAEKIVRKLRWPSLETAPAPPERTVPKSPATKSQATKSQAKRRSKARARR